MDSNPLIALYSGTAGILLVVIFFSSNRIFKKADAEAEQDDVGQPVVMITDDDDSIKFQKSRRRGWRRYRIDGDRMGRPMTCGVGRY